MSSGFIYYVYAYINKKTGLPYYIGKGKNNRAYDKHKNVSVPKDITKIVFLETNLSEIGALALERRYIKWYGKKSDNSGILLNIQNGGNGVELLNKGKTTYKNIHTGEIKKMRVDDPLVLSGCYVGITKNTKIHTGKTTYRNIHTGELKFLHRDDKLLHSGEWVGQNKGKGKPHKNPKKKYEYPKLSNHIKIIELTNKGLTQTQISSILGSSISVIKNVRYRWNHLILPNP